MELNQLYCCLIFCYYAFQTPTQHEGKRMITNLSSKDQDIFDKDQSSIITERVDDVPLLIGQMTKMGLQEILDRHIPRHWNRRLSWGWTAVIWLAYILSEGDHRKISMADYVRNMKHTLSRLANREVDPLDFCDDRLSHLLKYLSKRKYWATIEEALNSRSIEVYDLKSETIRCDATTVSANHEVEEDGLVQFGHSKDNAKLPQIKLMSASLDPLGMPLASDVVSGEKADDGLYIPLIKRIDAGLQRRGLLFVGDCKMSAQEIRAHLVDSGHYYLSPLPLTGNTAKDMEKWINQGIVRDRNNNLVSVIREDYKGDKVLAAKGYEFDRTQSFQKEDKTIVWQERVLITHSPAHSRAQAEGLEKRLTTALEKIEALTPPRGRGKRQISDETDLLAAIAKILKTHRVENMLSVQYEKQVEQKTKYVGRGRGSAKRETVVEEKVRYQIISVERDEQTIENHKERFGWKAFVTNMSMDKLSLHDAVLSYRNEYRIERIFSRLKSRLNIAPLFVRKDDQIEGLTYLLTLGVRVLTLVEFVVQRSLREADAKLYGMHPENRKKSTAKPSAERILKTFSKINLTIIQDLAGNVLVRSLSSLSVLQKDIIQRLELDTNIYLQIEIKDTAN